MANKNYSNGRTFEYLISDFYKAQGYFVARMAGSHGPCDLIAWNDSNTVLIQCKKGKLKKNYKEDVDKLTAVVTHDRWFKEMWVKLDNKNIICYNLQTDNYSYEQITYAIAQIKEVARTGKELNKEILSLNHRTGKIIKVKK